MDQPQPVDSDDAVERLVDMAYGSESGDEESPRGSGELDHDDLGRGHGHISPEGTKRITHKHDDDLEDERRMRDSAEGESEEARMGGREPEDIRTHTQTRTRIRYVDRWLRFI